MEWLPIVTAGATVKSNRGPVILIMNQYAHAGKGHTIHSSPQMEYYGLSVNEKSRKVGGLQRITTNDGFTFAINIRRGLPYLDMRPFTDKEWDELPHITITHEADWDPEVLDNELSDNQDWFDSLSETPLLFLLFDEQGALHLHVLAQHHAVHTLPPEDDDSMAILMEDEFDIDESTDCCVYYTNLHRMVPVEQAETKVSDPKEAGDGRSRPYVQAHKAHLVMLTKVDYKTLRSRFAWLPANIVQKTFGSTTQYAHMLYNTVLWHRYKAPHPALNHFCREEPVATDTIMPDTPAVDGGETWARLFVGTKSLLSDAYGMKTLANFSSTLMDNITQRGAPTKLISDRAQLEISKRVQEILRTLFIGAWQSEANKQHQNFAERHYQDIKKMVNVVLDHSGAPAYCWLLCLQ